MVAAFKVQLKSVWPLVLVAWFSMYLSWLAWCSHLIPTPPLLPGYKSSPSRLCWVAPGLAWPGPTSHTGEERRDQLPDTRQARQTPLTETLIYTTDQKENVNLTISLVFVLIYFTVQAALCTVGCSQPCKYLIENSQVCLDTSLHQVPPSPRVSQPPVRCLYRGFLHRRTEQ